MSPAMRLISAHLRVTDAHRANANVGEDIFILREITLGPKITTSTKYKKPPLSVISTRTRPEVNVKVRRAELAGGSSREAPKSAEGECRRECPLVAHPGKYFYLRGGRKNVLARYPVAVHPADSRTRERERRGWRFSAGARRYLHVT